MFDKEKLEELRLGKFGYMMYKLGALKVSKEETKYLVKVIQKLRMWNPISWLWIILQISLNMIMGMLEGIQEGKKIISKSAKGETYTYYKKAKRVK